ncbi:MAG: DUF402 domain-containing protein [Armatimonadota bacterium]
MGETITEIRHRVLQDDQIFKCSLLRRGADWVVVRYVNPEDNKVGAVTIPAGSITLAHYEQDAEAVWWEMYFPNGDRLADLIHIASPVVVGPRTVEYTDLLLDVWQPANAQPQILDDDELDEAVAKAALSEEAAEHIRAITRAIADDIPAHAPRLWRQLSPEDDA